MQLEFSSCQHHLGSVVCAALPLLGNNLSSYIIVNQSIRIWAQFRRHFGLQGPILSPIKSNHVFIPSCADPAFTLWFNKGIRSIHNLYIEDIFASFSQLSRTYDLPKNNFFFIIYRSGALYKRHSINFQISPLNHMLTIFLDWI